MRCGCQLSARSSGQARRGLALAATAVAERDRQYWLAGFLIAEYFALSVPAFAARALLQINLLCVLGEVISQREAGLVHSG